MPVEELQRVSPVFADARIGWEVRFPEGDSIHVEAAACQGRTVYFHVGLPGLDERLYAGTVSDDPQDQLLETMYGALGWAVLSVGAWLAWHHWRQGRCNPRGAWWLAVTYFVTAMLGWLLTAKHTLSPYDEAALLSGIAGRVLLDALVLGVAYLALEPFVRRRAPWRIIGWNRLLEGRWRDPMVGREIVIGGVVGIGYVLLSLLLRLVPQWLGWAPALRTVWDVSFTEGAADILLLQQFALLMAMRDFFLYFVVFLLCRRDWLAVLIVLAVVVLPSIIGARYPWIQGLVVGSYYALGLWLLLRFGLLAYTVYVMYCAIFPNLPMSLDFSTWYAGTAAVNLSMLAGLALFGFIISRSRRPIVRPGWWDE